MKNAITRITKSNASLLAILCGLANANATTWDAASDWSDTQNPNGPWSYSNNGALLSSQTWNPWDPGAFATTQNSWDNGGPPGWFKVSNLGPDAVNRDWQIGDVIGHSPGEGFGTLEIGWTSPISGVVDVAGAAWFPADQAQAGRGNWWGLYLNGTLLTEGLIGYNDPYNRANPHSIDAGSGGAGVVNNLNVNIGDTIELRLRAAGTLEGYDGLGSYAGLNFSISAQDHPSTQPVPESTPTAPLLAIAVLGAIGIRGTTGRTNLCHN